MRTHKLCTKLPFSAVDIIIWCVLDFLLICSPILHFSATKCNLIFAFCLDFGSYMCGNCANYVNKVNNREFIQAECIIRFISSHTQIICQLPTFHRFRFWISFSANMNVYDDKRKRLRWPKSLFSFSQIYAFFSVRWIFDG